MELEYKLMVGMTIKNISIEDDSGKIIFIPKFTEIAIEENEEIAIFEGICFRIEEDEYSVST